MTDRIIDHLSAADRSFLKAIGFIPPLAKQPKTKSHGKLFDELMAIAFPGIYDHVINPLEDPPDD